MAWRNKAVSAVKSALNKAKEAASKVTETVKKTVSDTVKKTESAVKKVEDIIKKTVSEQISKAKEKVKEVSKTIKKTVSELVDKADDHVKGIQNTVKEELWKDQEDVKKKVEIVKEAIKDNVSDIIDGAKEKVDDVKEAVKEKISDVVEDVKKKIEDVKDTVKETVSDEIKEVRRAIWPKMPAALPEKLKPYWRRMENAYVENDKGAMLQVLRELRTVEASPMPALVLILAVLGVIRLIVTLIGSYTFAGWMREEAVQAIDFAIKTATDNKDLEGLEKAIAFKKELLDKTLWEKILGAIPLLNIKMELRDYFKAAAVKLEIDENNFNKLKMEITGVGLPEIIKVYVRDIIDGDTIDTDLKAKDGATGEKIEMQEYGTTGHARIRIVGINAPEKSPKGEILCSDVEIYKVEKEFADLSRDRLIPLNDKEVILKIDPAAPTDTHGRILAVVEYNKEDIGLRQLKEGLACGYYRETHKYVDQEKYTDATLAAKAAGIGMWKGLEIVEKEEDKIKIKITSTPSNAKLFLDDIALHHNTPSDEIEMSDVMHLFTLGTHILSAEKGGLSAMLDIVITKGDNRTINLILETAPSPAAPTKEEEEAAKEEEEKEEEVKEEIKVTEPVKSSEIPKTYAPEQEWALKEAFKKVLDLTEGTKVMSEKERTDLINSFNLYTTEQKIVLNLFWRDVTFYTQGKAELSADELAELYEKYRVVL